jgi:hypothetical protein
MATKKDTHLFQIILNAVDRASPAINRFQNKANQARKAIEKDRADELRSQERAARRAEEIERRKSARLAQERNKRLADAHNAANREVNIAKNAADKIVRIEDKSVSARVAHAGKRHRETGKILKDEEAMVIASALRRNRNNEKMTRAENDAFRLYVKNLAEARKMMEKETKNVEKTVSRSTRNVNRSFSGTSRNIRRYSVDIDNAGKKTITLRDRWNETLRTGGQLSRQLGRLGLAIRGLAIVGVLAFTRALIASITAMAGAATSLAGSLIYAAGALGGTFTAAAAQALPVIGLLIGAFQRLSAINEAVKQSDLARKQQFGDTGAEETAIDNANQIADAQEALKEAQEGVTEARKDARKELKDLIYAEQQAELALRGSVLSQAEAQRALRASIRSGDVEGIARAQLDVDQSNFDVGQARRDLRDVRTRRRTARRNGVDNAPQVVNAVKAVASAQRNLADAHKSAATAAINQSAAERNLGFFLNELTKSERKLFNQFMGFRDRFEKASRPITDIIINAFSRGLTQVEKLLFSPEILGGFRTLAQGMSNSIGRVVRVFTGPEFKTFFTETLAESARNLPIVTSAFITIARVLKNIAEASAPVLNELLRFIVSELRSLEELTSDRGRMTSFFQTGLDHFKAWYELIKAVLGLFGELMGASSDSAIGMLSDLTGVINDAKEALKADDSGARNFFEDAAKSMEYIGSVVLELGKAFIELSGSQHVKALADIINKVLIPGLVTGIEVVGLFAQGLDDLIEIPFVSELLKWSVAIALISSASSSIYALFSPLRVLLKNIVQVVASLGPFQKVLQGVSRWLSVAWMQSNNAASGFGIFKAAIEKISFARFIKGLGIVGLVIGVIIGAVESLKENFLGIRDILVDNLEGISKEFKGIADDIETSVKEIAKAFGGGDVELGKFLKTAGKVIGVIFKLAGSFVVLRIIDAILVPIRFFARAVRNVTRLIREWITAIAELVRGDISFGQFLKKIGSATLDFLWNTLKNAGSLIFDFLKNIGKFMWNALSEGLEHVFTGVGETVVNAIIGVLNTFIDAINYAIDKFNSVNPFGDVEKVGRIEEARFGRQNEPPVPASEANARKRGGLFASNKDDEKDAKSKQKRAKATKKATDANLADYKMLGKMQPVSRRQIRLNNMLADSLTGSSKAHRRAQNLQEALNAAANRGANRQKNYAESVRATARAENRLSDVLAKNRRIRANYNQTDHNSVKIKDNLSSATRGMIRSQIRLTDVTQSGSKAQGVYNRLITNGTKFTDKYEAATRNATKQTRLEAAATRGLSRKLGALNTVLRITGENSRALGVVFRDVTNKLLKEFNVRTLKVDLPTVEGMFKNATGDTGFAQGGYFGRKGERKPDDRLVKVAGGEAFLTGAQQAHADRAFAVANAVGATPYSSLDSLFAGENRAHAGTGYHAKTTAFKNGGRNGRRRGNAGGRSIVIPRNVPDADGALPGLDLMGYLAGQYFGLSVTDGARAAGTLTASGNVSDHTWGGAIDISNGSSPTPQMDAAWQWFADVLGTGGSWVENYSGGAIKQMLYRTNIGGNHFNHIHLALHEQYARDVQALTEILTGQAVPVSTGGGGMMVREAPQLKRPKIKGVSGAIGKLLNGQSGSLTKGANKHLKNKIRATTGAGMSGPSVMGNIKGFDDINRIFAEHNSANGDWGGPTLPFNIVAALAESAGLPGVTFAQIAKGESGLRPGATGIDPGGTKGLGLWMITTGYNDALIARLGGEAAMRNPVINARAAKSIFDSNGYGAWYGTKFVTEYDKHYTGPMPHARGGKVPTFHEGAYNIGREYENDEITKRLFGLKSNELVAKLEYGETVLPKTGTLRGKSIEDRLEIGDGGRSASSKKSPRQNQIQNIRRQIARAREQISETEDKNIIKNLRERIERYRDDILLAQARAEYDDEIREKRKEIREKEKELQKANKEKRKKAIQKELNELNKELEDIKKERSNLRVFEGAEYNLDKIQDFMMLISDRITSFIADIEETVAERALATARWTYKLRKNTKGNKVVSRVNTAVDEAIRAVQDLNAEFKEISQALRETRRATRRTNNRIRRERREYDREIRKLQRDARNADDKNERKSIIKEIEKLREDKKDDLEKLRTSLENTNNKRKELLNRRAENMAARYEAQAAIFEAAMNRFDQRLGMVDSRIQIATLENSDSEGELTEAGRNKVRGLYNNRADILREQRERIRRDLADARRTGNRERTRELQQALLDNKIALLENTKSIKELDESVNSSDIFNFKTTNWEVFRQAILNGNGQLLPQLASTIPQLSSGGLIKSEGLAYLHAAEVVTPANQTGNSGPLVDTINFTQPMEVADPVAVSNQIGFKLSTLKSNV